MKWILLVLATIPASATASLIQFSGIYDISTLENDPYKYQMTLEFKYDSDRQHFYDWNASSESGFSGAGGVGDIRWSEYYDVWYGHGVVTFSEGFELDIYQIDLAGLGIYSSPNHAIEAGQWFSSVFFVQSASTKLFGAQVGAISQSEIVEVTEPGTLSILGLGLALIASRRRLSLWFQKVQRRSAHPRAL